jgi:hypothetical protein
VKQDEFVVDEIVEIVMEEFEGVELESVEEDVWRSVAEERREGYIGKQKVTRIER